MFKGKMAGTWTMAIGVALTGLFLGLQPVAALAADRLEEATVVGKDKSDQAGQVPSDTRDVPAQSRIKKEESPSGLKTDAPGVRTQEKMEKPRMSDPERKKPENKKGMGDIPTWMWIILIGVIAVAAG